jgi:hypothetical protein
MATYPDLPTARGSDPEPINTLDIDRAEDGTGRGRSYYAADKVKITVEHPLITAAQKTTLAAFYTSNRLVTFTYLSPSDSVSRTMLFAAPPAYVNRPGGRFDATVEMEEV